MRYRKGANAERELLHKLFERGYAVFRIAGSGSTTIPAADLIAIKGKKGFLIECKAWNSSRLSIKREQIKELEVLKERTGYKVLIAWKVNHKGWFFFPPEKMDKTDSSYIMPLVKAQKLNKKL